MRKTRGFFNFHQIPNANILGKKGKGWVDGRGNFLKFEKTSSFYHFFIFFNHFFNHFGNKKQKHKVLSFFVIFFLSFFYHFFLSFFFLSFFYHFFLIIFLSFVYHPYFSLSFLLSFFSGEFGCPTVSKSFYLSCVLFLTCWMLHIFWPPTAGP